MLNPDKDYLKAKHARDGVKVVFKMVTDEETGESSVQGLWQMRYDPIRTGINYNMTIWYNSFSKKTQFPERISLDHKE